MATFVILPPTDLAARNTRRIVAAINSRYRAGESIAALASDYNISEATVKHIVGYRDDQSRP